ncbi:hypothetical protein [Formosa sp. PL04]|uniref:hypothetical protein n=1 Tax=Formosa sp. PL04 TaxID=3081755 RepID=UPI002980C153|nr:hypothetical protein [Formosa sp. PL04]MDW5287740.1 hypothetical protein [Formosa sp. PL04]
MKYLLLTIFCMSMCSGYAQTTNSNISNDLKSIESLSDGNLNTGSSAKNFGNPNEGAIVKGSPYLFESWNNSTSMYFIGNTTAYKMYGINYNIQAERFELQQNSDSIFIVNPGNIERVVVNDLVFKRYLDPEYQRNSFFVELYSANNTSLLKKYETSITVAQVNPMTGKKIGSDVYTKSENYYILKDKSDGQLKEIKLNKNSLYSLVSKENQSKLKEFIKENKLSYRDESDLKVILNYAQSI